MVAFHRDLRHSMGIRRALGLAPFPRRQRIICVRPNDASTTNALDPNLTAEPVAYLRTEAMRNFTVERAAATGPVADVPAMVRTLDVQVPTARTQALTHDIALLLVALQDARKGLSRAEHTAAGK